jgi:hypothetical protein
MNEQQVRRALDKKGLALRKERARTRYLNHQGGYMIVNTYFNTIVAGERFDLTLEQAASFAD